MTAFFHSAGRARPLLLWCRGWGLGMLLCLLVGLPGMGWGMWFASGLGAGLGTPGLPGGYVPPQPMPEPDLLGITERYPLMGGTVSLPGLPVGGVVEMDAVEMTLPTVLRVVAMGTAVNGGGQREYVWEGDPDAEFQEGPDWGRVRLRWFWQGQRIDSLTDWLRDGNPGKGGSYEVKLYQTQSVMLQLPNGPIWEQETEIPVATASFQVVIRGHVPLAEGEPPVMTAEPDLPGLPTVTVLPPEGILLSAMANAGGPFQMRWFKNGSVWRSGAEVRVMPVDVIQEAGNFYCEAKGPTGRAVTETFRLRAPGDVWVDFASSVTVVEAGGTVRLVPGMKMEPEVAYAWSGPALTAGYVGAQVLGNGTLEISPARMEDAGDYFLTVSLGDRVRAHRLRVSVLRLPEGTYALGAGQVIPLEGVRPRSDPMDEAYELTWQFLGKGSGAAATFGFPFWNDRSSNALGPVLLKPVARMAGQYRCAVRIQPLVPQSRVSVISGRPYVITREVELPTFQAESVFELRAPWEAPVMPAHSLPPGRIGGQYEAPGPVTTAGAASAAVKYQITGLPRGLKGFPDGSVRGRPLKSGEFPVKFVARNAQGRSVAMEVRLTIVPLPEGVVGDWLTYPVEASGGLMQFKVTALGSVSGRLYGKPFVCVAEPHWQAPDTYVLYSNQVSLPYVELSTTTNLAGGRTSPGGPTSLLGWRNVWSRANPPEVYAGRYNFASRPLVSPRAEEVSAEAGYRSGTALVGATGHVKSVVTGGQGGATTSGFFLGPQGQVLHEMRERGQLLGDGYLALGIDETGQVIQGREPVKGGTFKSPAGDVHYYYGDPSTRDLWPELLERVTVGRRYTPPVAGALPVGFTLPQAGAGAAANARLTLGQPEAENLPAPESAATADAQAWLLAKGGRMRLMGPATHAATCKLHLPTGRFYGQVKFADGSLRPPKTKFQGYLIPQAEGAAIGYGATEPASGWETLPVRLEGE